MRGARPILASNKSTAEELKSLWFTPARPILTYGAAPSSIRAIRTVEADATAPSATLSLEGEEVQTRWCVHH
ncbi:hypothetical protein [Pseudomonas phage PIP]|nr:hypothetical protein [Pseudomonas phage PIP]